MDDVPEHPSLPDAEEITDRIGDLIVKELGVEPNLAVLQKIQTELVDAYDRGWLDGWYAP